MSLFSYLTSEVTRGYVLDHDEERYTTRRQKMYTFMKIPRELEKFMSYGFFNCLVCWRKIIKCIVFSHNLSLIVLSLCMCTFKVMVRLLSDKQRFQILELLSMKVTGFVIIPLFNTHHYYFLYRTHFYLSSRFFPSDSS